MTALARALEPLESVPPSIGSDQELARALRAFGARALQLRDVDLHLSRFAAIDRLAILRPELEPPRIEQLIDAVLQNDESRNVLPLEPQLSPTAAEPLRGLKHLGPIAIAGSARIVELAATPVVFAWQDIAVVGTIVLIAGPPAEGKTTLLFLVLVARANSGAPVSFLSREIAPAPAGQWIVLIEAEHAAASTARKLLKSLRLLEVDDSALDRIVVVARKSVRLGSPAWGDVVRMVAAGIVSDIAIDTLARVAPGDANDEAEQATIFNTIAEAIESAPGDKPTVWTVAHTRKGSTGDLEDISGSQQRGGQADTVMMVHGEKVNGRTVSARVTFPKLREDPETELLPITFQIRHGAFGIPTLATTDVNAADDGPLEGRIEARLQLGPKTKTELGRELKRSNKDIDDALSVLFELRRIRTTTTTVRGMERKAFELTQRTSDATSDERSRDDSPDEHRTTWDAS